eukprot:23155-Heterocapsa_arctica.AAC.1
MLCYIEAEPTWLNALERTSADAGQKRRSRTRAQLEAICFYCYYCYYYYYYYYYYYDYYFYYY